MLGLTGLDPETFPVETIEETITSILSQKFCHLIVKRIFHFLLKMILFLTEHFFRFMQWINFYSFYQR